MIFFDLFGLVTWGFLLWTGTGERAVIFYGWNNLGTDLVRARAVSGFIGLTLMLLAINVQVFSGYELSDQRWVFATAISVGLLYYFWRRSVAFKREKERLARSRPPTVLPDT